MRTTVRLNEDLLKQAKKRAAEEGRTPTSLVEEGLRHVVSKTKPSRRKKVDLPVSRATGGVLPGFDLNRSSELEAVMNEP